MFNRSDFLVRAVGYTHPGLAWGRVNGALPTIREQAHGLQHRSVYGVSP